MPYTNNYTKNYSGNYGTNYSNNYGTTYEMGFNKQYKDPFPGISKTDNYSTDTYNYKYEPINFSSESNKYKYDSLDYSSDSYTNSNKYKKYDGHGLTDYNYKLDDKDVQN
jgi:hypothetical protein